MYIHVCIYIYIYIYEGWQGAPSSAFTNSGRGIGGLPFEAGNLAPSIRATETMLAETTSADLGARAARVCW